MSDATGRVAIVDYRLGNLFSVKLACRRVGLDATITSAKQEILAASAIILPGVGAFEAAMSTLRALDLEAPLRDAAASGTPLIGICLGTQLLMEESYEFGRHRGLGLIDGDVVRLEEPATAGRRLKIPQVGWNRIRRAEPGQAGVNGGGHTWADPLLTGVADGEYMYFVHSFYCRVAESRLVLSRTRYGDIEFCSSLRRRNVVGFQFHPERSGTQGLQIYRNLAALVTERDEGGKIGSEIRLA